MSALWRLDVLVACFLAGLLILIAVPIVTAWRDRRDEERQLQRWKAEQERDR